MHGKVMSDLLNILQKCCEIFRHKKRCFCRMSPELQSGAEAREVGLLPSGTSGHCWVSQAPWARPKAAAALLHKEPQTCRNHSCGVFYMPLIEISIDKPEANK